MGCCVDPPVITDEIVISALSQEFTTPLLQQPSSDESAESATNRMNSPLQTTNPSNPSIKPPSDETVTSMNAVQDPSKVTYTDIDQSIFQTDDDMDEDEYCYRNEDNDDIDVTKCWALQRILTGLKYYQLLEIEKNPSNEDVLIKFCEDVYSQMLNDYQHIITSHSRQLESINKQIINDKRYGDCDNNKCVLFKRYYSHSRRRSNMNSTTKEITKPIDSKLLFYRDIFDNIHHWLFHLFQVGMRSPKSVINGDEANVNDNDGRRDNMQYIDHEFRRIQENIKSKRDQLSIDFERFDDEDNNKFTLQIKGDTQLQHSDQGLTFLDHTIKHLRQVNIEKEVISALEKYLKMEKYDSDSLLDDITSGHNNSNILATLNDEQFSKSIVEYVAESQSM